MISICPDVASASSHLLIAGAMPKRRGPRPKGKRFRYSGGFGISAQSNDARRMSVPVAMSDSQRRLTEYEGPLASSVIAGTTWTAFIGRLRQEPSAPNSAPTDPPQEIASQGGRWGELATPTWAKRIQFLDGSRFHSAAAYSASAPPSSCQHRD